MPTPSNNSPASSIIDTAVSVAKEAAKEEATPKEKDDFTYLNPDDYTGLAYSSNVYSGSSYGSRNYTSKIYSTPRSIGADRADTLSSRGNFGSAKTTYLHPSFSTKGSREAYKRQDL